MNQKLKTQKINNIENVRIEGKSVNHVDKKSDHVYIQELQKRRTQSRPL